MRVAAVLFVLAACAACGTPNPDDDPAGRADTRQIPTTTEPGIHLSGYANIGVTRRF